MYLKPTHTHTHTEDNPSHKKGHQEMVKCGCSNQRAAEQENRATKLIETFDVNAFCVRRTSSSCDYY